MAQNADHFKAFAPHTLLKHALLKTYLEEWARKLLLREGSGLEVCIVDACAGAGMDESGNPGSPVLAAQIATVAERQLLEKFDLRVRIHIVAIEQKPRRHKQLVRNVEPFGERIRALKGTLADYIEEHFTRFRDTPTLFFIDPFGLAPLQAAIIQRALSGPRNEVLLLFADQAALRHFGAATAQPPDVEARVRTRLNKELTFFDDPVQTEQLIRSELEARAQAKIAGQEMTRPRAIEILNAAYGSNHWFPEVNAVPPSQRRRRFLELYAEMLHGFGAQYVLPLPMRNDCDQLVYHLLHATKSPHGYTTMKEVISRELNRAVLPSSAVDSMRFEIGSDLDAVERVVRYEFAGCRIAWSDEDRRTPGLRRWVLQETEAFPFELEELKRRLKREKLPGRKLVYQFPALEIPAIRAAAVASVRERCAASRSTRDHSGADRQPSGFVPPTA